MTLNNFIVNFEHISHLFLVFLLLALNSVAFSRPLHFNDLKYFEMLIRIFEPFKENHNLFWIINSGLALRKCGMKKLQQLCSFKKTCELPNHAQNLYTQKSPVLRFLLVLQQMCNYDPVENLWWIFFWINEWKEARKEGIYSSE